MGIEEQTLTEVLQIQHGVLVDGCVDKFLHFLTVARHEDVLHEVDDGEDLVLVKDDEAKRGLDYFVLFFYDLGKADL